MDERKNGCGSPAETPATALEKDGRGRPDPREARLANALRANLRRRKAGSRAGSKPPAGA